MKLEQYEQDHLNLLYPHLGECALFLKCDQSFPLDKPCSIAAYGNGVRYTVKGGTGSGEVNSRFFINVEEGLKQTGFEITTAEWLDKFDENMEIARKNWIKTLKREAKEAHVFAPVYSMGRVMPAPEYDIELGEKADAAIYVVARVSGEGSDRRIDKGDALLTDSEIRDILLLNKMYEKFMLVINAGGVVDLEPVLEVRNILILSELGSETGKALGDILLGTLNPSGKLTATWARFEDYPYSMTFNKDDSPYTDGLYVGYRYFDSFNKKPLFPFGYGLSYSSFKIENIVTSNVKSHITVKVDVTNTSKYEGKEVVEVYLSYNGDEVYQQLVGFNKSPLLKEKEKSTVEVSFDLETLSKYDEDRELYYLPEGEYLLRVGNSSDNTVIASKIVLQEEIIIKRVDNLFSKVEIDELKTTIDKVVVNNVPEIVLSKEDFVERICEEEYVTFPEIVKRLNNRQLASLNVGYHSDKGLFSAVGESCISVPGGAGESSQFYKSLIGRSLTMVDGPAGLRVAPRYIIDKKGHFKTIDQNNIAASALDYLPKPIKFLAKKLFFKVTKVKDESQIHYQYCTALPIGTAIAQSWNKDFARMCGDIVGDEMDRFNVDFWLAPALNIHKSILCGRNFEYYSEDPILSGTFASEITKGVQSHKGKWVTIKHFAGNNQETNRIANNSIISERVLREIYLRGFEFCINDSHPRALMSSYNLINGTHTASNRELINDFLYKENDFNGVVMTDWFVQIMNSKNHKYPFPRASQVALSGTSFMMPGSKKDVKDILGELKHNKKLRKQTRINITRVINLVKEIEE